LVAISHFGIFNEKVDSNFEQSSAENSGLLAADGKSDVFAGLIVLTIVGTSPGR
jgi:hypothetical protein